MMRHTNPTRRPRPARAPVWSRALAALVCVGLVAPACGGGDDDDDASSNTGTGDETSLPVDDEASADDTTPDVGSPVGDDAERHYGFAPDPDADVTYQPDVVFIDGGSDAIRSASDDGLTWIIDGSTDGVGDITPGKVLFATSRAAGRVLAVQPQGDDLAVTLGPVQLGEVIKDGKISFSGDLDVSTMSIQQIPELPGTQGDLGGSETSASSSSSSPQGLLGPHGLGGGAMQLPSPRHAPRDLPPPFTEGAKEFVLGDWNGKVSRDGGTVTLHVEHVDDAGLKLLADAGFTFASPHLDADLGLVDGEVDDSELRLRGLRRVSLDLQAGSANGLSDNQHLKFEVPVSLDAPVILGGVAFNLNVRFKFLVNTAFSAKNSTLSAGGAWTIDGPLGFDKTSGKVSVQTPTITEEKSLLDSLQGISVGANGFVFATDIRIMLGLGIPAANAGPYGRLTTSVGLTVGSDLGIVKCRQATVVVSAGGGLGMSASDTVVSGINQALKRLGISTKVEEDSGKDAVLEEVYNHTFINPEKAICGA